MKTIKNKISVTVGIPAYNEAGNIARLLGELVGQKAVSYRLEKISVVSDGSTDGTAQKARKVGGKTEVTEHTGRRGQAVSQNKLMSGTGSDYLVLMNADILLGDKEFLEKLIRFAVNRHADLVSTALIDPSSGNFFHRTLKESMAVKNEIFEHYRQGTNLFTCHGAVRVFSKRLYSRMRFHESVDEDAYSYLYCLYHKYKYIYNSAVCARFRLPESYLDHRGRSLRFFSQKKSLEEQFGKDFVRDEYRLPWYLFISPCLKSFWKNPLFLAYYALVVISVKIQAIWYSSPARNLWESSPSTKNLA